MRSAGIWVLTVVVLASACERDKHKAPSQPMIDVAMVSGELEQRIAGLWDKGIVAQSTDAFFNALADAPAVRARASALTTALADDPAVAQPIADLMKQLTDDPQIQKAALALLAKHPGATPDQIGDMFGEHVEQLWNRPPVSDAWAASFQVLIKRVEHDPDLTAIGRSLFARVAPKYNDAVLVEKWNNRLVELAGGETLTRDKASRLFLDHFFANDRVDKLVADMLANPTLRAESANALAKLLAMDSVSRDLRGGAAELLSDPSVRDACIQLFRELAGDTPAPAAVRTSLDAILTSPAMLKALRRLIHDANSDPAVSAIGTAWLEKIGADPALQVDFDKFWFGW
ncbi:MAG: hypothetical protein ACM31C_15465 [Acidobacteriota bacterium]